MRAMFPVLRLNVRSKRTQLGLIGRGILNLSVQSSDGLDLNVRTVRFFKTPGNVYLTSQRNIPEGKVNVKVKSSRYRPQNIPEDNSLIRF